MIQDNISWKGEDHEYGRLFSGGGKVRKFIKGNIPPPGQAGLFPEKSGLPRLAQSGDDHDGHFFEG
jgi:hypothetical protein